MNLLPVEHIIYKTRLDEHEIIKRLMEITAPHRAYRVGFSGGISKPYEGKINARDFEISRVIGYRNSFLPIIKGTIQKEFDGKSIGSLIKVKMSMHIFVIVFLCIWCAGGGIACLAALTGVFNTGRFQPADLLPFGMLLFVYVLTMGAFKYESGRAKKDLQKVFEAGIEN